MLEFEAEGAPKSEKNKEIESKYKLNKNPEKVVPVKNDEQNSVIVEFEFKDEKKPERARFNKEKLVELRQKVVSHTSDLALIGISLLAGFGVSAILYAIDSARKAKAIRDGANVAWAQHGEIEYHNGFDEGYDKGFLAAKEFAIDIVEAYRQEDQLDDM